MPYQRETWVFSFAKHKVAHPDTHHEKHHSDGHGMNKKDAGKENGKPQTIDRYLLGLPGNPWA